MAKSILLTAMAGAMGWGIRGQYGHETGAMIAGVLVSLVLVLLHCPQAASLPAARAVAFGTIAMGIGGSMTYGQTIGLTQNPEVIGNWEAWRWGMLGLGIKGAIWIGFAGLFLGMALGGQRYSGRDVFRLMLGMFVLYAAGWWMLNQPFDPANRILPRVYFSASWRWQPEAGDALRPRPEVWGGLLVALIGAWAWAAWARGDRLARNLALWGIVGGLGFPIGQCLQSWHAWNRDFFTSGIWATFDPVMNWWNWMETTFGAFMGASLGLGVWLNRGSVGLTGRGSHDTRDADLTTTTGRGSHDPTGRGSHDLTGRGSRGFIGAAWPPSAEWALVAVHVALLIVAEFTSMAWANALYDPGLVIAFIPLIAVAAGRWWPFLVALPITLVPIAGKTVRTLVYDARVIGPTGGWLLYAVLPVMLTTAVALWFARSAHRRLPAPEFTRTALLINTWIYFALNFAFARFPWPWQAWTPRTPNAIIFFVCAIGLTAASLRSRTVQLGARFERRSSGGPGVIVTTRVTMHIRVASWPERRLNEAVGSERERTCE